MTANEEAPVTPCSSPECAALAALNSEYCAKCKRLSAKVLSLQKDFQKPIRKVLIDTVQMFPRADALAGALGVSQVTLYAWIRAYFGGVRFEDFKRRFLCRKQGCLILSTGRMESGEKYYVSGKLRAAGVCSCLVGRESTKSLILANCNISRLGEVFPGVEDPSSKTAPAILGRKMRDGDEEK